MVTAYRRWDEIARMEYPEAYVRRMWRQQGNLVAPDVGSPRGVRCCG